MRKELQDAISKKRRRRIDQGPEFDDLGASSSLEQGSPVIFDPQETVEFLVDGIPTDLESPAFDGQDLVEPHDIDLGSSEQQPEMPQEDLTDNFWQQLLNEGLGEENDNPVVEDDMNVLSQKMGYLNSDGPTSRK
jgi:heat shock transcription factor